MSNSIKSYSLNELNLYSTYGFIISSGSNDFLKMPKRKAPLSKNWPDQNGTQYDLTTVFFEDATATLSGYIVASNFDDFWNKYNALWAAFSAPGSSVLYIAEFRRKFTVFYLEMTKAERKTRLISGNMIGVEIDVSLQVLWPTAGVYIPPIGGTSLPYTLPFILS